MTRGDQRDRDREKAKKRNDKNKGKMPKNLSDKQSLQKKKDRDAIIMREKQKLANEKQNLKSDK